ncbi:xylulokinase [Sedimentitalea sp. HM32M-2]|uniref:xylulokinase n=1 Tax=Sedimentitalea sp. HM32M-2 TaxID=3351566 RepID=UPI00362566C7
MFIGLDLGTTGLRALLVDSAGRPIASAEAALPVAHPQPGWSEQDPADWIGAARQVLTRLRTERPEAMAWLRGIGLAGQMHGATLLDGAGRVLRPCILWNDGRSGDQAAHLDRDPDTREISGNIMFAGSTAPKLLWLRENDPNLFDRVATVLLPKDYLSFWLTGQCVSDMSDGAGTGWMDVGARAWSPVLLERGGMRGDQMPRLVEGCDVIGRVRGDLADELGLPHGISVVAGAADNAAAACGVGALQQGDGFVSLGTSGVLLAARDGFQPCPRRAVHSFCHAVPGSWYQMGVTLAATDSLNWLARITGAAPETLTGALGPGIDAPGPLRFLPYLSGERTPHNDSAVRGAFVGLDIGMGRDELTRAVLEGVCFALCDSWQALRAAGAQLSRLVAIGGGTRSRYWCELLATVLNLPVDLPEQGEFGAAMGAARLAICGVTGAEPAAVMTRPPVAETIVPRSDLRGACDDAYGAYADSYSILKAMP